MQRLRGLRRPPLVPKELIVPVCQRLAFILFVMCGTALSIRIYSLWKMGKFNSERMNFTPVNGTRFFLDIGNGDHDAISHTKLLEENGWKGICAGPHPEGTRLCRHISQPVAAENGDQVMVADCSQQTRLQVLTSIVSSIECPKVARPGVGIEELLRISKAHLEAPDVIDYVSLHTEGSELSILSKFPFKKFCARAWTVHHTHRDAALIEELFEKQGCHVKAMADGSWARCHCDQFAESLLSASVVPRVDADELKHRKRVSHSGIMVPSGMLEETAKEDQSTRKIQTAEMKVQRKEATDQDQPVEVDPIAETMHILGGSSGLGGSIMRKSFA